MKVTRHPSMQTDFNVKGVKYVLVDKSDKIIMKFIGDGEKNRLIALPDRCKLPDYFRVVEADEQR